MYCYKAVHTTRAMSEFYLYRLQLLNRSRISSGSIVSDYGLDDRSIPGGGKGFFR
jgi:hypothetical protein